MLTMCWKGGKANDASFRTDGNVGLVLATLGAVLFSTKAIFVKLDYAYPLTPETLIYLRILFVLPFYLGAAACLRRNSAHLSTRDLLKAAFGLIGYYVASLLDFAGLARISSSWSGGLVLFIFSLGRFRSFLP